MHHFQIKRDGYGFPVYSTDLCPTNEKEWKERSTELHCTKQKGYTCLPNEHFTELLEFCYKDPFILIEEGIFYLLQGFNNEYILYEIVLIKTNHSPFSIYGFIFFLYFHIQDFVYT